LGENVEGEVPLSAIVDAIPASIAYVDREQHYRVANGTYRAWFGDVRGKHLRDVLGDAGYEAIRRYVEDSPRPCALLLLGRYIVSHDAQPALAVLRSIESASFRDRYGPIDGCFPGKLHIAQSSIARDAHQVLRGGARTPIIVGDTTAEGSRGKIHLDYEVYSNKYFCFVLLVPHRRIAAGTPVRVLWN